MFDFSIVTEWINNLLLTLMPQWAATLVECVLVALAIITLYAVFAIILIYMERKICAFFQCRLGPNRVGKWGSIQVLADVLKMMTKEIIDMKNVDRLLHKMAPFLVIVASMLTFSCLPWNKGAGIIDFNVGVFFFLAAGSIGVVGILLAGWSSNNKYALIGAMRSGAQIISYEVSIGLVMLTMIVLTGTMSFSEICQQQADYGWNIFRGHIPALLAFIVYLIAGNAECNRGPFDMPEAESELTAGYHVEYSGMHFGFYYLAEYLNLFICAGIASTIFLGGWAPLHIVGLDAFNQVMDYIPGAVWMIGKTFFVVFLLMWIRWTFPRLRIDQLLTLEWKYLMPLSLVLLVLMAVCVSTGLTL
ncbi:MAG: NADH-quinone oxidoreductase subunit NuoH [Prevotellaceae bacterium]|nr:NADH-quinone oxidoreductase subunit NuoH [Prevotellaceae bacterium]